MAGLGCVLFLLCVEILLAVAARFRISQALRAIRKAKEMSFSVNTNGGALSALQTKLLLGLQALAIANQTPGTVLSLFR